MFPPNSGYFPNTNNGGYPSVVLPAHNYYPNQTQLEQYIVAQQWQQRQGMVLAHLSMAYTNRMYKNVYQILESERFAVEHHDRLQKMWYDSHYEEAKSQGKDSLSPVSRYRIRKKFPLPATIWDGEQITYCIKEKSRKLLHEIFKNSQYPTAVEKKQLSLETGLSSGQISNWFKNRRQRQRQMGDKIVTKTEESVEAEEKIVLDSSSMGNTTHYSSSSVDLDGSSSNYLNQYSYPYYQTSSVYQNMSSQLHSSSLPYYQNYYSYTHGCP